MYASRMFHLLWDIGQAQENEKAWAIVRMGRVQKNIYGYHMMEYRASNEASAELILRWTGIYGTEGLSTTIFNTTTRMIPSFSTNCSFSTIDIYFLLRISSLGCQIHVHGVFQAVGYRSLVELLHKRHPFVIFRYRRELGKRNQETEYIETYPTELMRRKLRYPVAKAEDVSIATISPLGRSVCDEN